MMKWQTKHTSPWKMSKNTCLTRVDLPKTMFNHGITLKPNQNPYIKLGYIYTLAKHGLLTNKRNGRKHDSTMVYLETCILLNQDHTLTNITKVGFKIGIYDSQTHALGLFWSVSTWHHPFCRFNDSEHTPWWRASRDGKDPPWSFRKDQWIG